MALNPQEQREINSAAGKAGDAYLRTALRISKDINGNRGQYENVPTLKVLQEARAMYEELQKAALISGQQ
ncbi:hypothetical protein [Azospirillum brasilense]|uniref:hypothetical protein n=1 Tax=Azospirillum brasilense TaxID=192 RepID=UPI0011EEA2DF|nr:hypothetical protein [Azospirillum brasilense]